MRDLLSHLTAKKTAVRLLEEINLFIDGDRDRKLLGSLRESCLCLHGQKLPQDFVDSCHNDADNFSELLSASRELALEAALWERRNLSDRQKAVEKLMPVIHQLFIRAYRISENFQVGVVFDKFDDNTSAYITYSSIRMRKATIHMDPEDLENISFAGMLGIVAHELIHANQLHNLDVISRVVINPEFLIPALIAVNFHDRIYVPDSEDQQLYESQLCELEANLTRHRVAENYQKHQLGSRPLV